MTRNFANRGAIVIAAVIIAGLAIFGVAWGVDAWGDEWETAREIPEELDLEVRQVRRDRSSQSQAEFLNLARDRYPGFPIPALEQTLPPGYEIESMELMQLHDSFRLDVIATPGLDPENTGDVPPRLLFHLGAGLTPPSEGVRVYVDGTEVFHAPSMEQSGPTSGSPRFWVEFDEGRFVAVGALDGYDASEQRGAEGEFARVTDEQLVGIASKILSLSKGN